MAKSASKKNFKAKVPAASKTHAASLSFNQEIELLLQLAADAPVLNFPERKSAAKLYELAVLAELLLEFQASTGGTITLVQPKNGKANTFAGAPASSNKDKYAWFELRDSFGYPVAEAWISVQFVGLSATLARQNLTPGTWVNESALQNPLSARTDRQAGGR